MHSNKKVGFFAVSPHDDDDDDDISRLCFQVHLAGQQKMFNIFSLRSGGAYLVQVRCKPDHGFWSEWTSSSQVQVPECELSTVITPTTTIICLIILMKR